MKDQEEARLDSLYRLIVTAQRSRERGGHYKCTFQSANFILTLLFGEIPKGFGEGFNPDWAFPPNEDIVLVPPGLLKIKTPDGWKSGVGPFVRKTKREGSTR